MKGTVIEVNTRGMVAIELETQEFCVGEIIPGSRALSQQRPSEFRSPPRDLSDKQIGRNPQLVAECPDLCLRELVATGHKL